MSNPKDQSRRRDDDDRISASHLTSTTMPSVKKKEEDEDWGEMPNKTAKAKDEDLERELEEEEDLAAHDDDEDEEEEDEDDEDLLTAKKEEQPVQTTVVAPQVDLTTELQNIERLQNNLPALVKALETKISSINDKRRTLDEEEKQVKSRINFLRALNGEAPLSVAKEDDDDDDKPAAPRRRGGRRRKITPDSDDEATTPADNKEVTGGGRGGRGKRHSNNQTLKEAIMRSLYSMKHPTSTDPEMTEKTGFVNDITRKVTKEQGYKTTSEKPTNTVRIQMYRLEEDKMVKQNEDGSYTLRKKGIAWVDENGIKPKEAASDD
jgi:hypothetical protein